MKNKQIKVTFSMNVEQVEKLQAYAKVCEINESTALYNLLDLSLFLEKERLKGNKIILEDEYENQRRVKTWQK